MQNKLIVCRINLLVSKMILKRTNNPLFADSICIYKLIVRDHLCLISEDSHVFCEILVDYVFFFTVLFSSGLWKLMWLTTFPGVERMIYRGLLFMYTLLYIYFHTSKFLISALYCTYL